MKKILPAMLLFLAALTLSADAVLVRLPAPQMKKFSPGGDIALIDPKEDRLIRAAVLDFTNADTQGSGRFMNPNIRQIKIPQQNTLNDADRKSVNSVMQGFIRLLDAWDTSKTGNANRAVGAVSNKIEYDKSLDLYRKIVQGPQRPLVTGADYFSSLLGRHGEIFSLKAPALVSEGIEKIIQRKIPPRDAMHALARMTGVSHLIVTSVSDPVSEVKTFKGYGIETKTTFWKLDVSIRVIDLIRQGTVYSNVFSGMRTDRMLPSGTSFTNDLYQVLLHDALEKASKELYLVSINGPKQKIKASKLPALIRFVYTGKKLPPVNQTEVFINGHHAGTGLTQIELPEGKYTFSFRAPDRRERTIQANIFGNTTFRIQFDK